MDMRRIMLYKPGDHIFWHDPDRDISTKPIVIQTIRFFPDANEVEVTADDLFHYHGTPDVFTPMPLHIVVPTGTHGVTFGAWCTGPFSTEGLAKAAGQRIYTAGEQWTTGLVFEERDDTAPVRTTTDDPLADAIASLRTVRDTLDPEGRYDPYHTAGVFPCQATVDAIAAIYEFMAKHSIPQ